MSKKEEYKEPELIIDGQKIKFHYSRTERLAMKHNNPNEEKNCFFCLKNVSFMIMVLNLVLIFLILIGYYSLIGRSKGVIRKNFYYNISVKKDKETNSLKISLQIKNILNKKNELSNKEFSVEIYDKYLNLVSTNKILIEKTEYEAKEFNIYQLNIKEITPQKYIIMLKNGSDILIEMNINIYF